MMFKCSLCEKHSFKKKHKLQYKALNEWNEPQVYVMNICHKCAERIEKYGQEHDKDEEIPISGDAGEDGETL
jgi:uncharacterized protein YlaI